MWSQPRANRRAASAAFECAGEGLGVKGNQLPSGTGLRMAVGLWHGLARGVAMVGAFVNYEQSELFGQVPTVVAMRFSTVLMRPTPSG